MWAEFYSRGICWEWYTRKAKILLRSTSPPRAFVSQKETPMSIMTVCIFLFTLKLFIYKKGYIKNASYFIFEFGGFFILTPSRIFVQMYTDNPFNILGILLHQTYMQLNWFLFRTTTTLISGLVSRFRNSKSGDGPSLLT